MDLIRDKADLIIYLTTKQLASKEPPEFAYVTTALRRKVLTDEQQGKFTHKGTVVQFEFENIGGGVYKAFIAPLMKKRG